MTISVVSTLYRSRRFLETFLSEITDALATLPCENFELIFVNDGSPDDSCEFLVSKKKEIPEITVIDLSRNFGHHYAMQAGLQHAKGDYIFLVDNDLEVSPWFITDCFKVLEQNPTADVAYGFQEERKGKMVESLGGKLFWWALDKVSEVKIPHNILTERLMTREYVRSLLSMGDANLFIGGMMYWTGYKQIGIPVQKGLREGGSTYGFKKRLQLMIQAITSFSGKPLEFLFYTGLTITFLSVVGIIYLVVQKIIFGDQVELGWTSLIAINMLMLGILSTFLGLIGIYLYKIFRQVQNRPNAIIRKIY